MKVSFPHPIFITRLFVLWLFIGASNQLYAAGELLISPTRVVFEERTRTATLSLVNAGDENTTYRIGFVQRRMAEDGSFSDIKTPRAGELFADRMIRFSPRQVILKPGQAQVVRLMLRKPPKLADGEYRSHLLFRAIPKAETTSLSRQNANEGAISIQLTPIMGISVPIIVRHGKRDVTASIEQLRFYKDTSNVLFEIHRKGNNSLYGNITVSFINPKGESIILKKINGLAVYTPNEKRRFNVPFIAPAGIELNMGHLLVQYHAHADAGGRLISENKIALP